MDTHLDERRCYSAYSRGSMLLKYQCSSVQRAVSNGFNVGHLQLCILKGVNRGGGTHYAISVRDITLFYWATW